MENSVKRRLIAAFVIAVGLVVIQGAVSAQPFYYTCIVVNGQKVYVTYDDPQGNGTGSTGSGSFSPVGTIPPTGPLNVQFNLTGAGVSLTTSDPTYGTITTTSTGASGPSTVITNEGAARLPATGTIRFFARATISSKPNDTFTSLTELVFENNNLQSFDPFSNETFTLKNDVTFGGGSGPFILKAGTTVTLNGYGDGLN